MSGRLHLALVLAFGSLACSHDALRGLPCVERADCTDGLVCGEGFCRGCTASTECGEGETCTDARCEACDGGTCTEEPPPEADAGTADAGEPPDAGTTCTGPGCAPCDATSDCTGGTVCRHGTCSACVSDAECGGELTCEAGTCQICSPELCPIDPTCDAPDGGSGGTVEIPKADPLPQTVPANCLVGFEMNNMERATYAIDAKTAAGSRRLVLEVDFATYRAPDSLIITAIGPSGAPYELMSTCHLKTADYGNPVRNGGRPPEDSIREFRVPLAAGTKSITFDFSSATSPNYLRVLGLCDFDLVAPTSGVYWKKVTSR